MKKIFLLSIATVALMFAFSADANATKRWDFSNWSSTTKKQVLGAADWTKDESASKTYITGDEIRWVLSPTFTPNGDLTAGGDAIAEFEGLRHDNLGAYGMAMAFDYGTTTDGNNWGPYASPSYLWVTGASSSIVVPNVKAGSVFKLGVESHKLSEARGFKLTVGETTIAAQTSKAYAEVEYIIPEGGEEYVDVAITATKGAHLYFIEAEVKDAMESVVKVGYLYDDAAETAFEELPLYTAVKDIAGVTFEPVGVSTTVPEKDAFMAYDAVIIDGGVAATEALTSFLEENIFWQPVINFSQSVAVDLGFGEAVELDNEFAWFLNPSHSWIGAFEGFANEDGTLTTATAGNILPKALKLTGHVLADKVIVAGTDEYATPDSVIAYVYNAGHNSYIYYGVPADFAEGTEIILQNIILYAINTKAGIAETPAPTCQLSYGNQVTWMTLSCSNKYAMIYYTTDGTEPTLESLIYAGGTLEFDQPTVIKAFAIADGYTASEVKTFEIQLFNQAKTPTISVAGDKENGDVVITLACEDEGVEIWYNFSGSDETAKSSKYDGPITIKRKAEISAFAFSDTLGLVQSNLAVDSVFANMKNVRRDVVAHFSANGVGYDDINNFTYDGEQQTAWANSSKYYFSWGKTARASVIAGDPILDGEGNQLYDDDGNPMFEQVEQPLVTAINANDPDWALTSQGQVMIFQTNGLGTNVGDGGGYNPERAEDIIEKWGTNSDIQFGGVASGDKATAAVRSMVKYAGPFNVISVIANAGGGAKKVAIQTSKDGEVWETLGDTLKPAETKRLFKTFEVAYDGTDEVYVRVASISGSGPCVHDIYVLNSGEKSKAEIIEYETGIKEVNVVDEAIIPAKAVKMIKNGKIVIVTAKGAYSLTGVQLK